MSLRSSTKYNSLTISYHAKKEKMDTTSSFENNLDRL